MGSPPPDKNLRDRYRESLVESQVYRLLGLYIDGIEVTQAIQYYHADDHLTDPADREPDNSVRLISGKPAWVRVYVRCGLLSNDIPNITGSLEIFRRYSGLFFSSIATLSPQPPGIVTATKNPDYATERSSLGSTLNFIIPAANVFIKVGELLCGALRLRATIKSPDGRSDSADIYVNVHLRQTLRVRGIFVAYNGPASSAPNAPTLTLPAPPLANLQTTAAFTLLTYPVRSNASFSSGGAITWNQPLTDPQTGPGQCSANWTALNAAIQTQKTNDGNLSNWLYYGLLPAGIPNGPVIGCESGSVSAGLDQAGVTMAHELGHLCGLQHAPCGGVGSSADPSYPAYEPYDPANSPQASIGEYGLNTSNGNILSPAVNKDFMSYCSNPWISLYHYGKLLNNDNLQPESVCHDEPWWDKYVRYDPWWWLPQRWIPDPPPDGWENRVMNPEPLISIIGAMQEESRLEVTSVMRVEALSTILNGVATDLLAELIADDGRVIASGRVFELGGRAMGCGCGRDPALPRASRYPAVFQAFIPNVSVGASLRIRRGEKELWSRQAPKSPVQIATFTASVRKDRVVVTWQIKRISDGEPEIWLQSSVDRGRTWRGVTTGLKGREAQISTSNFPTGRIQLRLLVGDGFQTAISKRVNIMLPKRTPAVSILTPRDGEILVTGGPMRMWATVSAPNGDGLSEENGRWMLDNREVGHGFDLFVTAPKEGRHQLKFIFAGDFPKTESIIKFTTVTPGRAALKQ